VFALNVFLATASWCAVYFAEEKPKIKYFFSLAFLAGLAAALHHTYILILPAVIYWIIVHFDKFKKLVNIKNSLGLVAFFLCGFSLYLYVFWDSGGHSPLGLDSAKTVQDFLHLFLRQTYGTLKAYPGNPPLPLQRLQAMEGFFRLAWSDFFLFGIVLATCGLFWLSKKNRPVFFFSLIWFIFAGPFFQFMAGFPLTHVFILGVAERFLILAYPVIALWLGTGACFATEKIQWLFKQSWFPFRKKLAIFFAVLLMIYPLFLLIINYSKVDFRNFFDFDILAENYLNSIPEEGVFLPSGDTPVYIVQYAHFAKGVRPDLTVANLVDLNGLRYYQKFKQDQLIANAEQDFLKTSGARRGFLDKYAPQLPIFTNLVGVAQKNLEDYEFVPWGLIYRIYPKGETPSFEDVYKINQQLWGQLKPLTTNLDDPLTENYQLMDIMSDYEIRLMELGNYFFSREHYPEARFWFNKIFVYHPDSVGALQAIAFSFLQEGQCESSLEYLDKAEGFDPESQKTVLLEARVYRDCLKDEERFKKISQDFEVRFGQKIEELLPK